MRTFFWLWVMFILLCLITDSAAWWVVRGRLSQGLDLALDAALVRGISEEDLIRGRQLSSLDRAAEWAGEILRKNMEGPLQESLTFQFSLNQDAEQVWAEGYARVVAPSLLGALTGRGSREITVGKKQRYQGIYK